MKWYYVERNDWRGQRIVNNVVCGSCRGSKLPKDIGDVKEWKNPCYAFCEYCGVDTDGGVVDLEPDTE